MFETINGIAKATEPRTIYSDVRFVHLRRPLIECGRLGVIMGQVAPTGGLTIAYQKMSDTHYKLAVARCNPSDHYDRAVGRCRSKMTLLDDDNIWNLDLSEGEDFYTELIETLTNIGEFRCNLSPVVVRRK